MVGGKEEGDEGSKNSGLLKTRSIWPSARSRIGSEHHCHWGLAVKGNACRKRSGTVGQGARCLTRLFELGS